MGYLFITISALCVGNQYILGKIYDRKVGNSNSFCYTFLIASVVFVFYLIYGRFSFSFERDTLFYGLGFGICYCMSFIFQLLAIRKGPLSLTSLVMSYSLIIPILTDLIFNHARPNWTFYVALAALAVAIFLIAFKFNRGEDELKITPCWAVFAALAMLTNGLCSVIQSFHQESTSGLYKSELMLSAMCVVLLFSLAGILVNIKRKEELSLNFRKGWWVGGLCGLCNALTNLCAMLALERLPSGLVFALVCGISIVTTYLVSALVFRERLRRMQIVGIAIGLVAAVLFNF